MPRADGHDPARPGSDRPADRPWSGIALIRTGHPVTFPDAPPTGPRRATRVRGRRHPRRRLLIWTTILGLIVGALQMGTPVENMLRGARDIVRSHDASGQTVVVGVDEQLIRRLDEWPLRRSTDAQLVDRLNALGARRILFEIGFVTATTPRDDAAMAAAIARSRAPVVLPAAFSIDEITGRRTEMLPIPAFSRHATLANSNVPFDFQGVVRELPYAMVVGGKVRPSMAATLAHVAGPPNTTFPIDYSVDVESLPTVSADDVLTGRVDARRLAGRDVLVGYTSTRRGNSYVVPRAGQLSGVYLHALGAETLRRGQPVTLPWLLPFGIAWLAVAVLLFARRPIVGRAAFAAAVAAVLGVPFLLDAALLFVEVVPAIVVLLAGGLGQAWLLYRAASRQRAVVNMISGLPNLNALRAVASEPDVALVAARIRNFSEIAASLASEMECELVEQVARRLALGSGGATIYQGDEGIFAWLMPCESGAFVADQFDALHALFRHPIAVGGRQVDLAITFGIARDPDQSPFNRLGGALMAADGAAAGGERWRLHEPLQASDASWKLSLLSRLDKAIDAGEIWVAFQPKIDLASGRVSGAEALVRWSHPTKGQISPGDFVLVAEQHDRIGKLTWHVLDVAIRAAAEINAHGIPFGIAVNLSVRLIEDPGLVERVVAALDRHGMAARHLTLEITETAALSGNAAMIAVLDALRAAGINLSIDDYGTGFSNMGNLRMIPANEIKIDRSFVDAIDRSRSDAVMVRSTIQLAHSLGQTVVAEGVERAETLDALRIMGCDTVQGYHTGRPMAFVALSRILLKERGRRVA